MKWDGKAISRPGLYENIPLAKYHRADLCVGPSASSSMLRTILTESPAHMHCRWAGNPEHIEEPEKDAFVLGRAAHHLLLGEDDFRTEFVVRPDVWQNWMTKDSKTWRAHQQAAGRTVLTPNDITTLRGMAKSLSRHPLIKAGILNGEIERSLVWQDKASGIWLKSRPDACPTTSGDFADLKTTRHVGFDLDKTVLDLRYDVQAALTKWAAKQVLDIDMQSFSFVFVESAPPYCVDVLTLRDEDIAAAEDDLRIAIDTFAYCLKSGDWFGPSGTQNDARYAYPSEWQRAKAKLRREFLAREIAQRAQRAA